MVHNVYQLFRHENADTSATWLLSFEDSTLDAALAEFTRVFCDKGYEIEQRTEKGVVILEAEGGVFAIVEQEHLPDHDDTKDQD